MGSSITCTCGKRLHKNLFAGAHVCVVIQDDVLDEIEEAKTVGEVLDTIADKGDRLVRCVACGRVAIEHAKTGNVVIYVPESA